MSRKYSMTLVLFSLYWFYRWISNRNEKKKSCEKEDPYTLMRRCLHPRELDTSEDHTQDQFLFSNAIDEKKIEPWVPPLLRFHVKDFTPAEADLLYTTLHRLDQCNQPTVLLAKQPPTYPLFFDLDIKGRLNATRIDSTLALLQLEKLTLFRHIAHALKEVYTTPFRMVIYESHGISIPLSKNFTDESYAKASFHVVFPDIIVDRPENCMVRKKEGERNRVPMKRHMRIVDHVRLYFEENEELTNLLEDIRSFDYEASWAEIFDEYPCWHECWDDLTGMRLCYTKKKGEKEDRVKRPWKAFQVHDDLMDITNEVNILQWSQWGNVLDPRGIRDVTEWNETRLRKYENTAGLCECRFCWKDKKYEQVLEKGWELGWEKQRDPKSDEVYYSRPTTREEFWLSAPGNWRRFMHPYRGRYFWRLDQEDRYFWDP